MKAKAERQKKKDWNKQEKDRKETRKSLVGNVTKCFRKKGHFRQASGAEPNLIEICHGEKRSEKPIIIVKNWII